MKGTSNRMEQNPLIVVKGNCEKVLLAPRVDIDLYQPSLEVAVGALFGLTRAFVRESNGVRS